MKYLFLNHFTFENIDNSISQKNIIKIFLDLAILSKNISKFNSQIIFDNKLASFIDYIKLIDDREIRIFLMAKIKNPKPFCSDNFDGYFEDENIVLGNCVVKNTNIGILENFLACAMFLNSPIITPKTICKKKCFLNETIDIKCDNKSKELKNYFLENSEDILNDTKEIYLDEIEPLKYCLIKFKNSNLNFSNLDNRYGFNLLETSQQKEAFLSAFNGFSKMSWNDIIKSSANKKGLNYKAYDGSCFKNTQYSHLNIFKFRVTQKYRCFGYREKDEFFVLRFEIDHKISDKG